LRILKKVLEAKAANAAKPVDGDSFHKIRV
jgi:hypothetical protein